MEGAPEQFLLYQHNVQKFFQRHLEKYSGVIVPLSIAVSFEGGTYGFVRALCTKDPTKTYAIDPRNPLFQKPWDRSQARGPHYRMAEALGLRLSHDESIPHLTPDDLDNNAIRALATSTINYQMRFSSQEETSRKLRKYSKLLGVESLAPLSAPQFVIPPYFEMNATEPRWSTINLRAIEHAIPSAGSTEVRPVIHFADWNDVDFDEHLAAIQDLGVSSIFLYPNDFHEHDANVAQLVRYRDVVRLAAAVGLKAYSMFGGYFAALLRREGLIGFANGVGYGEWRDSGYHRGGTPGIRIYIPKLHRYLDPATAQGLLDKKPEYFGGDSDLLSECALGIRSLPEVTNEEALDHLMECRRRELDSVSDSQASELMAELTATVDHLEDIGPLEREKFGESLIRWRTALDWSAE